MEPIATPPASPAPSASSGAIDMNQIASKAIGGMILGFSIAIGFFLAQKAMKKEIRSVDKKPSGTSEMYGRERRMPPPDNRMQMNTPYNNANSYMYANGQQRFDKNEWSEFINLIDLSTVKD